MTNFEKLIETLQNAPIEKMAYKIDDGYYRCEFCAYDQKGHCTKWEEIEKSDRDRTHEFCRDGIKQWLESEVDNDKS